MSSLVIVQAPRQRQPQSFLLQVQIVQDNARMHGSKQTKKDGGDAAGLLCDNNSTSSSVSVDSEVSISDDESSSNRWDSCAYYRHEGGAENHRRRRSSSFEKSSSSTSHGPPRMPIRHRNDNDSFIERWRDVCGCTQYEWVGIEWQSEVGNKLLYYLAWSSLLVSISVIMGYTFRQYHHSYLFFLTLIL